MRRLLIAYVHYDDGVETTSRIFLDTDDAAITMENIERWEKEIAVRLDKDLLYQELTIIAVTVMDSEGCKP